MKIHPFKNNIGKEHHPDGIPEMFTVKEAAKYIGVEAKHVYLIIQAGRHFPSVDIGGRFRISRYFIDKIVIPDLWKESEGFDSYIAWLESGTAPSES